MAQIQFRSDDTTRWGQGYGNSSGGASTIAADVTESFTRTTFSGTATAMTGTVGSNAGLAIGQIVLLHQTQTSANVGKWQFNYIVNISGTTITFLYALTVTYTTGAQLQVIPQYTNFTVNGGVNYYNSAWNGSTGGVTAIFASGTINIAGSFNGDSRGFRDSLSGGSAQGEGSAGSPNYSTAANGSGAGGGGGATDNGHVEGGNGGGGAGGGNNSGGGGGQRNTGTGGAAGNAIGSSNLTTFSMGGAGGWGGNGWNTGDASGGAYGAASVILVARIITVSGNMVYRGGGTGNSNNACGGAGGGGTILLKGQNIAVGTSLLYAGGGSGGHCTGNFGGNGGNGGGGTIHADYASTFSGAGADTTIDTRIDGTLAPVIMGGVA